MPCFTLLLNVRYCSYNAACFVSDIHLLRIHHFLSFFFSLRSVSTRFVRGKTYSGAFGYESFIIRHCKSTDNRQRELAISYYVFYLLSLLFLSSRLESWNYDFWISTVFFSSISQVRFMHTTLTVGASGHVHEAKYWREWQIKFLGSHVDSKKRPFFQGNISP